ncbi:hypothetical protein GLOTRDRAFT_90594 [Gloeophyllum trabeum ATCC 11539]|uniref:Uncharacterized protein n=1 Tax=Gloeophyllum trabeum (strain ATCC 11539 / FP-39264 / Madison 617) TaxID=670483 RepID=S7QHY2_GLOTA|nr:uncharacterized protein GLOTRDRAFT_90594 [Gloeophyllum trabeum ATCC 11539]EPQ58807.1 hypothetical protein GLOTRDRAFT_90594 [Gloeophyllum trabeum ATCC 11539]
MTQNPMENSQITPIDEELFTHENIKKERERALNFALQSYDPSKRIQGRTPCYGYHAGPDWILKRAAKACNNGQPLAETQLDSAAMGILEFIRTNTGIKGLYWTGYYTEDSDGIPTTFLAIFDRDRVDKTIKVCPPMFCLMRIKELLKEDHYPVWEYMVNSL